MLVERGENRECDVELVWDCVVRSMRNERRVSQECKKSVEARLGCNGR